MKRDCTCPRARHTHGTYRAYSSDRCRCAPCTMAHADWQRAWRKRKALLQWRGLTVRRPTIGTRRRLQALAAIGWTAPQLAEHIDVSAREIAALRTVPRIHIRLVTAVQVAAAYDRLWDKPQTGAGSMVMAAKARRFGYAPPMAWDDIDDPDAVPDVGAAKSGWDLQPCGTAAAARRHRRRGEMPLDAACAAAELRDRRNNRARKAAAA